MTGMRDAARAPPLQKEKVLVCQKIRLIDVTEIRVVESNLNEDYAALSYVWGSGIPPADP